MYRTPTRHQFDRHLDQVSAALPSLPDVCNTADLARVFRNSELFWKIKRREGSGPKFFRAGCHVKYLRADIISWVAARMELKEQATSPPPPRPKPIRRPLPPAAAGE